MIYTSLGEMTSSSSDDDTRADYFDKCKTLKRFGDDFMNHGN